MYVIQKALPVTPVHRAYIDPSSWSQDWTVSKPESVSKKIEPETSALKCRPNLEHARKHISLQFLSTLRAALLAWTRISLKSSKILEHIRPVLEFEKLYNCCSYSKAPSFGEELLKKCIHNHYVELRNVGKPGLIDDRRPP